MHGNSTRLMFLVLCIIPQVNLKKKMKFINCLKLICFSLLRGNILNLFISCIVSIYVVVLGILMEIYSLHFYHSLFRNVHLGSQLYDYF